MYIRYVIGIVLIAHSASEAPAKSESFWNSERQRESSMYADRKAGSRGDILTIIVDESTTMTRSVQSSSSRTGNLNNSIAQFLYPRNPQVNIGVTGTKFGTHNGGLPGIDTSTSESFQGEGSIADTITLNTRFAVMVVDRLPNGNIVVEGARKYDMKGDVQYLVFRGIVRPDDIDAANSVMSSKIANATVDVLSEGDIEKAQKKGVIHKLLDVFRVW